MALYIERLAHLAAKGFSPKVIYDVGAHYGFWSHFVSGNVYPSAQYFLFEANEDNRDALNQQPFPFFIDVLGDEEKEALFYCTTTGVSNTGESLFCEQTTHFQEENLRKRTVKMTKLATVAAKNGLPKPDLIKLDVQGAEKMILEGSKELVCQAEVIIIEMKILEFNKGAPLIHEMLPFMASIGYRMIDLLEFHRLPSGDLNEMDMLFVKFDSKYIKTGMFNCS